VWSVGFDQDGKRVISASASGEVVIWDLSSNVRIALPRQSRSVSKAAFSHDQRFILTSSADHTARIWDSNKLTLVVSLKGHAGPVLSAAFSRDGRRVVTSSDDETARLWNIDESNVPLVVRASDYPIESSAITHDGRALVVGTFDRRLVLYEIAKGGILKKVADLSPGTGAITSVSFGMTSKEVAFASDRGQVMIWRTNTQTTESLANLPPGRSFVSGDSQGRFVVASGVGSEGKHNEVRSRRTQQSALLRGARLINGIEFSHDGTKIAAASDAVEQDQRLAFVWDANTGAKLLELRHASHVLSAHFSNDGSRLATSSLDRNAYVWDLTSGKQLQVFRGHTYDVHSARLSRDGLRLLTSSSDRTVRVWDVETAGLILQLGVGVEVRDAFFVDDETRILVPTASGEILTYDVSWTVNIDKDLKSRVCRQKLSNIDVDDDCSRAGMLSIDYWKRLWRRRGVPG
jgi:WD40 repeat protein